jgi:hypothetical protein
MGSKNSASKDYVEIRFEVKTGKEDLEAYIEKNKPVWEMNVDQAKERAAETVKQRKQELTDYLKEKTPEWNHQMATAKEMASDAIQTGTKAVASKLRDYRDRVKNRMR